MSGYINASDSIHWGTPDRILVPVRQLFAGVIDLDPCSGPHSAVKATVEYTLPANNGLADPWDVNGRGTTVFVNPPYGRCFVRDDGEVIYSQREWSDRVGKKAKPELTLSPEEAARFTSSVLGDWVEKARIERALGAEIVMLLPAAVDTSHWQDGIFKAADGWVAIRGRLKFRGGSDGPAPMACAVAYWGPRPQAFAEAFKDVGTYHPISADAVGAHAFAVAGAGSLSFYPKIDGWKRHQDRNLR